MNALQQNEQYTFFFEVRIYMQSQVLA